FGPCVEDVPWADARVIPFHITCRKGTIYDLNDENSKKGDGPFAQWLTLHFSLLRRKNESQHKPECECKQCEGADEVRCEPVMTDGGLIAETTVHHPPPNDALHDAEYKEKDELRPHVFGNF